PPPTPSTLPEQATTGAKDAYMKLRRRLNAWITLGATALCSGADCTPAAAQATYHINTDCGDDAWTGASDIFQAPDGPKRTIGAGIAAAASGDTLRLAPGVYAGAGNVNLAFSTDLRLIGAAGASATIIDGGSAAGPALDIS